MSLDSDTRKILVEALYKAVAVARSGKPYRMEGFMEMMKNLYPGITDEQIGEQTQMFYEQSKKICELIENGNQINSEPKIKAVGTGLLLYQADMIHSLKMGQVAKLELDQTKSNLKAINALRIRYVGGSEDDHLSKTVGDYTK